MEVINATALVLNLERIVVIRVECSLQKDLASIVFVQSELERLLALVEAALEFLRASVWIRGSFTSP